MLLVADIGNTSIHLAIFDNEDIVGEFRIPSREERTTNEYVNILKGFIDSNETIGEVDNAIISSVVPHVTKPITNALETYLKIPTKIVNPNDIDIGITIKTGNPNELGSDRIVNSYAGYKMYGGPCVVIDAGTATTFDVINKDGEFIGGVIASGLKISTDALSNLTALLPEIDIKNPDTMISTTTEGNMQAGALPFHATGIEGTIKQIEKELGEPVEAVLTGGYSRELSEWMIDSSKVNLVPNLTIEGLRLLHDINDVKKKDAKLAPQFTSSL